MKPSRLQIKMSMAMVRVSLLDPGQVRSDFNAILSPVKWASTFLSPFLCLCSVSLEIRSLWLEAEQIISTESQVSISIHSLKRLLVCGEGKMLFRQKNVHAP